MTAARFPSFARDTGGYESFYVRAVDPRAPRAVWLRHTVHQASGRDPVGSCWITLFDARWPHPLAHKASFDGPAPLPAGGLHVGHSSFAADGVHGGVGERASWDLAWEGDEPPLSHLPAAWMYRARLPRTKLESPRPAVRVSGVAHMGDAMLELDGWPGMVGHNWGTQHAERWIWLHGALFEGAPEAWLDLSLGRVRLGGATTPWVANGALSVDGERLRLGGLRRRVAVKAGPRHVELVIPGQLRLTARSPLERTVVWRYADPDGSEHHVANCSIAPLELVVQGGRGAGRTLRTAHGGAYEHGAREAPAEPAVQPFGDP
ncbi:MAG TPA: hypothetical protein VFT50_10680 [Baekduia sp.]|nr:hypothetical protein [Baekduia sp.]